mgnify:CR=1 FL=1
MLILSDLESGALSILELIENLGGVLTSHELGLRKGGLEILSNVLQSLPPSYITAKELEHLVGYYANSLADHHSLSPAVLRGFLALVKEDKILPSDEERDANFYINAFHEKALISRRFTVNIGRSLCSGIHFTINKLRSQERQ